MANLINGTLIDLLVSSAETMQSDICQALERYRKEREAEYKISRRFKDDDEYFAQSQAQLAEIARDAIAKAERVFSNKVEEYSTKMENELRKHLHMSVNDEFHNKLKMISDFGIQPEPIEIEDLLSLNQGNQTGLQALSATLKKINSPYVLTFHTTADFQNDIAEIKSIMRNVKYIPREYIVEGVEIYKGIPYDYVYPNGNVLHGAGTYDRTNLSANSVLFEQEIEKIKGLKNVWSADCSYTEVDHLSEEETEIQKQTNKYLADAGLPTEEITEPESETKVSELVNNGEGMRIAKEIGERNARNAETYSKVMSEMVK